MLIDFSNYTTYETIGVILGIFTIYLLICAMTQKWLFIPEFVINKIKTILKMLSNSPTIASIITLVIAISLLFTGFSLLHYTQNMNSPHYDISQNITIQKTMLVGSILRPNSVPIIYTTNGNVYEIVGDNCSVYIQLQEGKSYEVMMSVPKLYGDERDSIRMDNGSYIDYVVREL